MMSCFRRQEMGQEIPAQAGEPVSEDLQKVLVERDEVSPSSGLR
jgi:hypothetical protein